MKEEIKLNHLFDDARQKVFSNIVEDRTGAGLDRNLHEQRAMQVERAERQIDLRNAVVDVVENVGRSTLLASLNAELGKILQEDGKDISEISKDIGVFFSKARQNPLLQSPKHQVALNKTEDAVFRKFFPTIQRKQEERLRHVFLENLETNIDAEMHQVGILLGACLDLPETDPLYQHNKKCIIQAVSGLREVVNEKSLPQDVKKLYSRKINNSLFDAYVNTQLKSTPNRSGKIQFLQKIRTNSGIVSLFNDGQCPIYCGQVSYSDKERLVNGCLQEIREGIKAEKNSLVSDYITKTISQRNGFDLTNGKVCSILDDYFKNICEGVSINEQADYKEKFDLFLTQTGYVPASMQDVVCSLASAEAGVNSDGTKTEAAYMLGQQVLGDLLNAGNLKFAGNTFLQTNLGSFVYFNNLYKSFASSDVARRMFQNSLVVNPERDRQNGKAFDEISQKEDFKSALANRLIYYYGDEIADSEVSDLFNAELQRKIRDFYCKTGDLSSSIDAGILYERNFEGYSFSEIDGTKKFTKYAPEKFYRTPFYSVEDMRDDFKGFTSLAFPGGKCFIKVDKKTLKEIQNGSATPSYLLCTTNDFGETVPLLDDNNMHIRIGSNLWGTKEDDENFRAMNERLKFLDKLEKNKIFNALP